MKKMMFLSKNWYFSVQKALIYYTFTKSHHNSFILLVFHMWRNSYMWRILDFLLYHPAGVADIIQLFTTMKHNEKHNLNTMKLMFFLNYPCMFKKRPFIEPQLIIWIKSLYIQRTSINSK